MAQTSVIKIGETSENGRLDAEFYRNIPKENPKLKYMKIRDILNFVQYGISIEMNENGSGYKIYRMNEIEDMFCIPDISKFANISEKQMKKFKLKDQDVLFNRTNSFKFVGRTGIFKEFSKEDLIFASYLVRIRPNKTLVLPEYLTSFLNCKLGIADVKRRARISINQSNVSAQELQEIKLPIPNMKFQIKIKEYFNKAFQNLDKAKKIYYEAEKTFLEDIELSAFKDRNQLSFIKKSNEVFFNNRVDAEYFEPKYNNLTRKIKSYSNNSSLLKDIIKIKDKKFSPKKDVLYKYIELSNIIGEGKISGFTSEIGRNLPTRARRKVIENDVIISSIEGSLSSCALITSEYAGALCSTGFYVLSSEKINPETLLIMFKSAPFQALLKKGCSGTILTAINKDELEKIEIPIVKNSIQKNIAIKIKECYRLRLEAKGLLDKAKKEVESFIESKD